MGAPTDANGELLCIGYRIRVRSTRYGVDHHGIVYWIQRFGDQWCVQIVHNTTGVKETTLGEFAQGQLIYIVDRPKSPQHTQFILTTAHDNIGKPYFLFSQNCEHFCSFCYRWEKKSESVEKWLVAGLVAGGLVVAASLFSNDR